MASPSADLGQLLSRLQARGDMDEDDCAAFLALPYSRKSIGAGQYIVSQGEAAQSCFVLLKGFAYRHIILHDGARQVLGIHIEGDLIDLQFSMLHRAGNNVQALTPVQVAVIPQASMVELIRTRPNVAEAMWSETLTDMAVLKEWIANIGRRNARARLAHIICELSVRQATAGLGSVDRCELPMTQEQLADTLGLTAVHVNRTLHALEREGLIERERRSIRIPDWTSLARAGGFSPAYLHLPQPVAA